MSHPQAALPATRRMIHGPAGMIELLFDAPVERARGIALIAHPQPLLGGSARHKVPQLLARTVQDLGWLAVRPNFRGVGATEGEHDEGRGETDDMLAVVGALESETPGLPLALIGFSFGAFVQSRVAKRLADAGRPAAHVILAGLPVGTVEGKRSYPTEPLPAGSLVVHGELDESVPLGELLLWARPQVQPVTVIPGSDHFFKGRLAALRSLVVAELIKPAPGLTRP